jgi:hypothetical protein
VHDGCTTGEIGHVTREEAPEVVLIQHNNVVQAFVTNTRDGAFYIRILPGAPWGDRDLFDAHVVNPLLE